MYNELAVSNGATLTIGPGITVQGQSGYIGTTSGSIVNQGLISSTGTLGIVQSGTTVSFDNQGTIQAVTGASLSVTTATMSSEGTIDAGGYIPISATSWTNSGTVEASDGGSLSLGGTWTDSGPIIASSSGVVSLGGSGTVGAGSSFTGSDGTIDVEGTLDNAGNTLAISGTGLMCDLVGGTLEGGTISTVDGAALVGTGYGGTIAGVTLAGTLDMISNPIYPNSGPSVAVTGGLTLDGGTIELGSTGSVPGSLIFQGAQTLGGTGSVVLEGGGVSTERTLRGLRYAHHRLRRDHRGTRRHRLR